MLLLAGGSPETGRVCSELAVTHIVFMEGYDELKVMYVVGKYRVQHSLYCF